MPNCRNASQVDGYGHDVYCSTSAAGRPRWLNRKSSGGTGGPKKSCSLNAALNSLMSLIADNLGFFVIRVVVAGA